VKHSFDQNNTARDIKFDRGQLLAWEGAVLTRSERHPKMKPWAWEGGGCSFAMAIFKKGGRRLTKILSIVEGRICISMWTSSEIWIHTSVF
jgi:hypothetical protein